MNSDIVRILCAIVLIVGGIFNAIKSLSEMKKGKTLEAIYYLLNLIGIYIVVGFASVNIG